MRMGLLIIEQPLARGNGLYDSRHGVIYLHDGLSPNQRLCALQHEIIHAEHHRRGMQVGTLREERLTRKETALRLISQADYATVEQMYEADVWHMAGELGVTVQVLEDYRQQLSILI
ncbi:ImmA/IrrE family metallo-endopeptidase [Bifidobacterium eulemuris]|nr:ImmA/IrrE family metallo-endopeptidase [Bifidobacterium eulemuris]